MTTADPGWYVPTRKSGARAAERTTDGFFAAPLRDYVLQCLGQPVNLLQAGCLAPLRELGIGELSESGFDISVTAVDADHPLVKKVLHETASAYDDVIIGDLRTVPIPQRRYDIVYCAQLLERVEHVELVLDRLVSALKPGGLLLLQTGDRRSAGGLLDRMLPQPARKAIWSRLHPGIPGPFPAVYEKAVCDQGIASYTMLRGLVIAARGARLTLPPNPARLSSSVRITRAAISRLTRGRFDNGHDELLYVIRKPQDRFARVVLATPGDAHHVYGGARDGEAAARGAGRLAGLDTQRGAARGARADHFRCLCAADGVPDHRRPGRGRRER